MTKHLRLFYAKQATQHTALQRVWTSRIEMAAVRSNGWKFQLWSTRLPPAFDGPQVEPHEKSGRHLLSPLPYFTPDLRGRMRKEREQRSAARGADEEYRHRQP